MPNPIAVRLFDALLGSLLRPRIRRVRRWSFLVTAPLGLLVGRSLGDGAVLGGVVALLDAVVVISVTLAGSRLLGQERRDALLDLLMHPVARRAIVGEARMLSTFPAALLRRLRPPGGERFACHRGSHELGFALALLPAMLAEGAAVHLLLPAGWFWPKLVLAALLVYGVLMLLSWAAGERTHPHRLHRASSSCAADSSTGHASRRRTSRRSRSRAGATGSGAASCSATTLHASR